MIQAPARFSTDGCPKTTRRATISLRTREGTSPLSSAVSKAESKSRPKSSGSKGAACVSGASPSAGRKRTGTGSNWCFSQKSFGWA
jgi:hypothetical protein